MLQGFLEKYSTTSSTRDPSPPAPSPRWTHWNVGDVYETRYRRQRSHRRREGAMKLEVEGGWHRGRSQEHSRESSKMTQCFMGIRKEGVFFRHYRNKEDESADTSRSRVGLVPLVRRSHASPLLTAAPS